MPRLARNSATSSRLNLRNSLSPSSCLNPFPSFWIRNRWIPSSASSCHTRMVLFCRPYFTALDSRLSSTIRSRSRSPWTCTSSGTSTATNIPAAYTCRDTWSSVGSRTSLRNGSSRGSNRNWFFSMRDRFR